jgi:hypothetical protein
MTSLPGTGTGATGPRLGGRARRAARPAAQELRDHAGDRHAEAVAVGDQPLAVERPVDPERAGAVHRRPREEHERPRVATGDAALGLAARDGVAEHHEGPLDDDLLLGAGVDLELGAEHHAKVPAVREREANVPESEAAQVGRGRRLAGLGRACRLVGTQLHRPGEEREAVGGDRAQQLLAALEVVVGRARRHPGLAGQRLEADRAHALLLDDLHRGVHQHAAEVAVVVAARFFCHARHRRDRITDGS